MENSTLIYWITRLDYINTLCHIIFVISITCLIVIWATPHVMDIYDDEDDMSKYKKRIKRGKNICLIALILSVMIATFLPKKSDMILIIAGGKALDYVQQDSSLSKIPYQATEIISKMLDEKIKELDK